MTDYNEVMELSLLEEIIDNHIASHQNKSQLAYERAWFKEMEQEICIVEDLNELKKELI